MVDCVDRIDAGGMPKRDDRCIGMGASCACLFQFPRVHLLSLTLKVTCRGVTENDRVDQSTLKRQLQRAHCQCQFKTRFSATSVGRIRMAGTQWFVCPARGGGIDPTACALREKHHFLFHGRRTEPCRYIRSKADAEAA